MEGDRFPVFRVLSISLPILLIFFTLLFSVTKYHEILFSTCYFITLAKSSRIAVFFVFNVIIIIVLVGSLKPSDHQDAAGHQLITSYPPAYYVIDANDDPEDNHGYDGHEENDDDLDIEDDQGSEEDEKDNDLERRAEEFIAMVTRTWREELLTERLLCITAS